ncbi:MAG: hypothetical protein H5U37_07905, partial [Caldisericia bacterium]|nr:hypothetical protein [Caldisericia bacterium]
AFLISPEGWSYSINKLIKTYQRNDILEYDFNKRIKIAKWDLLSKSIKPGDYL